MVGTDYVSGFLERCLLGKVKEVKSDDKFYVYWFEFNVQLVNECRIELPRYSSLMLSGVFSWSRDARHSGSASREVGPSPDMILSSFLPHRPFPVAWFHFRYSSQDLAAFS